MTKRSVHLISSQKSQQLVELAQQARASLSRYAGVNVDYNAVGLQMLDEWIERHMRQFPTPSSSMRTVWGAFLGETFRRRYHGQWGIEDARRRPRLGVICPREAEDPIFVDVMDQVSRRVRNGMSESLAFYYTIKGVEIRSA
jgi:hypothetical protein